MEDETETSERRRPPAHGTARRAAAACLLGTALPAGAGGPAAAAAQEIPPAPREAGEPPAPPPVLGALVEADRGADDPLLVLYPGGPALVTERLVFQLRAGLNTVSWDEPPDALDPSSLSLSFPGDGAPTVLESVHRQAAAGVADALRGLVGEEVAVELDGGRRVRGTLVSARDAVALRLPESEGPVSGAAEPVPGGREAGGGTPERAGTRGAVALIPPGGIRSYTVPGLPGTFRPAPGVAWRVRAVEPGRREAEVAYLASGLSWDAEYVLELSPEEERLDLDGWAVLHNATSRTFREARVKLVAGDVRRAPRGRDAGGPDLRARLEAVAAAPAETGAEAGGFGPHRLFEIPREVTVAADGEVRTLLLRATGVPVRKELVVTGGPDRSYAGRGPVLAPETGTEERTDHAAVQYVFSTGEDGAGRDLPSGRVRVYRRDEDGDLLLEGEDLLPDTPRGDSASVATGRAFRVLRERTRTGFLRPDAGTIEESFGLSLRNSREEPVELRVLERLHRWREWEVVEARLDGRPAAPQKVDAGTVEWRVRIPAEGERTLDYTVRYSFPPERGR